MRLTPAEPSVIEAIRYVVKQYPSIKSAAAAMGVSDKALGKHLRGIGRSVSFDLLSQVLKYHPSLTTKDFPWYSKSELIALGVQDKGLRIQTRYKIGEDKVVSRRCYGSLHNGDWVPVTEFYKIKSGRSAGTFRHVCKSCERLRLGVEPMVYVDKYKPILAELINRVGVSETQRRTGLSEQTIWRIRTWNLVQIRRETARRIVAALMQARKEGIVRHKDSIHHGAYLRGKEEKVPTNRKTDFYNKGNLPREEIIE